MTSTPGNPDSQKPTTALVLTGGGARGAYQVGVLRALVDMGWSGHTPFPVCSGTSAGAVNAAVLASHADDFSHAVERLAHFWSGLTCSRIYRTDFPCVLGAAIRWFLTLGSGGLFNVAPRALLDNQPLRELLTQSLQLERIPSLIAQRALGGVAVTASAYTAAQAVSFFQGHSELEEWHRTRRIGRRTELSVDHIMGSVALPMIFPAQRIGHEYFGDGGMRMSAPLSPAIHLGADRIMVIATRDGTPDPEPETPTEYPTAGMIGGYLLDTVFMDTMNADLARLNRVNHTLSLMNPESRVHSELKPIESLVIRPSRDLRDLTAEHASAAPSSVKLLLRTLGGWGRDWRMASYLLFEGTYTQALMDLGYKDGMDSEQHIREFLTDSD